LAGASDLDAYTAASNAGFKFFIRLDYHGKVFSIPDRGILVGSANATLSGFGLKDGANEEVCTIVPPLLANLHLVDGLFAGAILLDDQLFKEIRSAVLEAGTHPSAPSHWPASLMSKLHVVHTVGRLLLEECFWSAPSVTGDAVEQVDEHDRHLLGLAPSASRVEEVKRALASSRMYMWLVQRLESEGREMYFGELSAALQSSLLDNPGVHRRDAKLLLQNLLTWCERVRDTQVVIDRPSYSQRVRLA
jgi:hypothetical protein